MIQAYADDVLVYDSRLRQPGRDYTLLGFHTTKGVNKGGTADMVLPPGHPAYSAFTAHRTILEVYRDGELHFRGRALYPMDDHYNRRTWTFEGERCFLQDGLHRAYLYQDSPANIFTAVINDYNAQVDSFKQFVVGEITVTDPNDYIRIESETAEPTLALIDKLQERCGGSIVFTTNGDGYRAINWLADPGYRSGQVVEFGANLLDFSRTGANTDLVTVVVPFGAKTMDENEDRVTIASVNGGVDYLEDAEAVALRGRITRAVYWDDVTEPANLLRKAQAYLAERAQVVTSLTLTALDLSCMDRSIDNFDVGDTIRVRSKPHAVDSDFLLLDRTEDLLNPAASTITLGKSQSSLTDADVAGDNFSASELQKTDQQIRRDYNLNLTNAIAETERYLTTLIQQTSESIRTEVSATYSTNDQLTAAISTSMTQLANSFEFSFSQLQAVVDENNMTTEDRFTEINRYISFDGGAIRLGASDSSITLTLENDMIVFRKNGEQFGWWDGVDFHTGNIVVDVNERAQFGNFAFVPRTNGSLSFLKVGG